METDSIFIMGSYAVGMTVECPVFPDVGETVKGTNFASIYGGKGSNQAIAAARLGGNVTFCTCLGDDTFGKEALRLFTDEKINKDYIKLSQISKTGVGIVMVDPKGQNEIVIVLGANEDFTAEDAEKLRNPISESGVVLLQLEFNLGAVVRVIEIAEEYQIPVILNPAPYQKIPEEIIKKVTFLLPNEVEALQLLEEKNIIEPSELAEKLYKRFACNIIITLGKKGCYVRTGTLSKLISTYPLEPVDTTGAGDTFSGAFAYALSKGMSLEKAIDIALAASAISVTRFGVVESIPRLDEVLTIIKGGKK
ncbi:ribokinase [Treponema sp. HNW]|uniref:ribokinase n=1 Tax=Treponema sp. HNW TaxID=3116654 RepID=UPI003D125605